MAKNPAKKSAKKTIPPTPVVEEPAEMPDLNELDMSAATADREIAVAEKVETEPRKGLFLKITGAAKRLMLLSNRSLRDLFPTVVWVTAALREQKPEAFRSEDGEKKLTVFITEESVMETIIENTLEASLSREASREDVEQELGILMSKIDWYSEHGFGETLSLDGFRERANEIKDDLAKFDDDVNPASSQDFRRILLDTAALIDELEESSVDNLEGAIIRLLGPEKGAPQIAQIWENAHGDKGFFWAKGQLLELRKKTIEEKNTQQASRPNGNGNGRPNNVRDARQPMFHKGFQPHW